MNRQAKVLFHGQLAGVLSETAEGYNYVYDTSFLESLNSNSISKTMPLRSEAYESKVLFSFFDGLIPEGWLLDIAVDNWKISPKDRFGILLTCCKNTIGAVSVIQI